MRILFIGRNAKIGGGTTYLRNLMAALQQHGCHCQLMTRGGPALPILKRVADRIWWLPPVSWWAATRAEKTIRNQKIDVVNALTTTAAQHLLAACRRTNAPLIITVLTRTPLDVCRAAANYAHAIVALNRETSDYLQDNHPQLADKLYLSSKPLPRAPRVRPSTSAADAITVTYMARLTRTKGPCALDLIEAWPGLVSSVRGLKLVIVEDGRLTIVYGARSPKDLLFKDELDSWAARDDVEFHIIASSPMMLGTDRLESLACHCGKSILSRLIQWL